MKNFTFFILALILSTFSVKEDKKPPTVETESAETFTPIFEKDLSVSTDLPLSVYKHDIREVIADGKYSECDCRGLCSCNLLYHISSEGNFYSNFFNTLYHSINGIYRDCSISMEKFFSEETYTIFKNLSPFLNENGKVIEIFKNSSTDLYGFLKSFNNERFGNLMVTVPRTVPIIITDLWDTESNTNDFRYMGQIVFCVPYASTNKSGVIHCESVVNNILWNHSIMPASISISIIYTDEVIVEYSNGFHNGNEGFVTILVP